MTIFVEVPDVEAALARAEALGAKRLQGPDDVLGGLQMGKVTDPEGHLVGVVSAPVRDVISLLWPREPLLSMSQDNKRLARRAFQEIYGRGNLKLADELIAP